MGTALCGAERRRSAEGRSRVEHVEDRTALRNKARKWYQFAKPGQGGRKKTTRKVAGSDR